MSAVMNDYTNEKEGYPYWSNYHMNEEAGLDEAFQEWGFSADDPFYEYHSEEGADVTLYYDEVQERGLGIFGGGYGFGFNKSFLDKEDHWNDWARDPMSPPERNYPEDWTDFREEKEYDETGRLTSLNVYANTGDTRFDDPTNCWLYGVDYAYDETGKLCYKNFRNNPSFGNYAQADEFWYDAQGRLLYAEGYITHGRLYYYYIYEDEGPAPAYLLKIDDNLGYADPLLICYPQPLTLAREELDYAVLRHSYDDDPCGFDFDEAAQLEERFQACGFAAEEPFYEFYDQEGRRELALWYDELTETGIGLWYKYYPAGPVVYGFGFEETLAAKEWEQAEYIRWEPEHNVYESCYDDLGRLTYEEGYITHGSLRYYYIYEGENVTPKYVLFLDDGTGVTPELVRF